MHRLLIHLFKNWEFGNQFRKVDGPGTRSRARDWARELLIASFTRCQKPDIGSRGACRKTLTLFFPPPSRVWIQAPFYATSFLSSRGEVSVDCSEAIGPTSFSRRKTDRLMSDTVSYFIMFITRFLEKPARKKKQ